jgi:hypothetical protein
MSRINTLKELKVEQNNLRFRKTLLEAEIKSSFDDLKSQFSSLKSVTRNTEDVLASKNNSILGASVGHLADFIAEKIIFRKAGFITRLIVPYLVKQATSNLVENNKTKIRNWFDGFTEKLGRKVK